MGKGDRSLGAVYVWAVVYQHPLQSQQEEHRVVVRPRKDSARELLALPSTGAWSSREQQIKLLAKQASQHGFALVPTAQPA